MEKRAKSIQVETLVCLRMRITDAYDTQKKARILSVTLNGTVCVTRARNTILPQQIVKQMSQSQQLHQCVCAILLMYSMNWWAFYHIVRLEGFCMYLSDSFYTPIGFCMMCSLSATFNAMIFVHRLTLEADIMMSTEKTTPSSMNITSWTRCRGNILL